MSDVKTCLQLFKVFNVGLGPINRVQGHIECFESFFEALEEQVSPTNLVFILNLRHKARLVLETSQFLIEVHLSEVSNHSIEHFRHSLLSLHVGVDGFKSFPLDSHKLLIGILVDELFAEKYRPLTIHQELLLDYRHVDNLNVHDSFHLLFHLGDLAKEVVLIPRYALCYVIEDLLYESVGDHVGALGYVSIATTVARSLLLV